MLAFLDHLVHYIEVEIECTRFRQRESIDPGRLNEYKGTLITWTGSKRALLELIYALFLTLNINHGKISIKELVGFFSHTFNIALPGYHSVIKKMTGRIAKKVQLESRTFFLNELTAALNYKLECLDEN